jgi:preprotein translocase subunit SecG
MRTTGRWEVLGVRIALVILQYIVCLTLIVSVLLQPGKSAGLSGSIAGGAEQLFGKKASKGYDALFSKLTTASAILFMVLSVVLVLVK